MVELSTKTAVALSIVSAISFAFMFTPKKWIPRGQHCYITGGSAGLGLALAILLTKNGANVSIVARNEPRLKTALEALEAARQNPEQILKSYSYSLTDATEAAKALEEACEPYGGKSPDAVFLCAGTSTPGFFVEETEMSMRSAMDAAYWVSAWTALTAAKRYAREQAPGKIVFVSSFLGYMSMIGYSSYSPAKHAIRGLAETLRSELILYGVAVHIFFPGTIFSPGYETEELSKPDITKKIEKSDGGMTPEESADGLLRGIQRGEFHISADLLGNIFRSSTRGSTPQNNVFTDVVYSLIGWVGLPLWRKGVDAEVLGHRVEHTRYLQERNFFEK